MATILNQAKETLKTCRKVKKEAENMYVYKNDKRAIDVMMYLEIPTVFPACFSFLNYKVDLLPSVY